MRTRYMVMMAAGVQNILAGLVATWNTFSVYVDPLDIFGAAGMSALLGFGMARSLVGWVSRYCHPNLFMQRGSIKP